MMEILVGSALALAVSLAASVVGLDRDRAFYTTVALAVGTYYLVFAVTGGSGQALIREIAAYAALAALALVGFRESLWLVAAALAGHGVFDLFHGHLVANDGVPGFWPMFCMSYDVTAALCLAWLLRRRSSDSPLSAGARSLGPYVQSELVAAERESNPTESFRRLERAHVLSQTSTWEHVRVHWQMLLWGLRQRQPREIAGQILRIAGALTTTGIGLVPIGNTGGASVGPFKPMPVPEDLAETLAAISGRPAGTPALPRRQDPH